MSKTPAIPDPRVTDKARLAALADTGLMDSPPEEAFDRAVRLATRLLGTPVGLLSLVDGERQFFKAQTGLPEATAQARQTPLTHSFCQHVVAADAPLKVRDAREDPLVKDNLAIRDLDVIAYLGVPVRAPGGAVLGSFCAIQSEPRDWTDGEQETLADIAAAIETEISLRAEVARSQAMEAKANAAEERFRLALHAGQVGTYDFDPQTEIAQWDDELYAIWGMSKDEPDVFAAVQTSIHPDDKLVWETDVAACLTPGGTGKHDLEMRVYRPGDGALRWFHAMGQASFEDGVPVRLLGTVRDITEQKDAERREHLLTQELNHRVKNLFAIVSGMISITARATSTPKQMGEALRGRVQALASAHALIQPAITGEALERTEVTLQSLAAVVLEPHTNGADTVTMAGPPLPIKADGASNLALLLHELATNAVKYGSLSIDGGKLSLTWDILRDVEEVGGDAVRIEWLETGGPEIWHPPETKGFGSTLMNLTVSAQMKGRMRSDWARTGVKHTLLVPKSHFSAK